MPRYTLTTPEALEPSQMTALRSLLGGATLEAVRPRLEVHGRRWFQHTYGNTYHSVTVCIDGRRVARCDYAYGYGSGYSQTAVELLKEAGIVPADHKAYVAIGLSDLFEVVETVEDVPRKRDL